MHIKVDVNEPKEFKENIMEYWATKDKTPDAKIERVSLVTGDYVWDDKVAYERKTIEDFWNSLQSGRLHDQVGRMVQTYEYPCLIVEGSYLIQRLQPHRIQIEKALNSLSWKIPIIRTSGPKATIMEMYRMYHKYMSDGLDTVARANVVVKDPDEIICFLCGIPGVGVETARAFKREFSSLADCLNYLANSDDVVNYEINGRRMGRVAEKITEFILREWANDEL